MQPKAGNISERPSQSGASGVETPFEQFLLAEYDHIAHAHFNMVESLSNFIKHYIAIASIPFAIAAVFLDSDKLRSAGVDEFVAYHPLLLGTLLIVLSLVGFCLLGYILNIRLDAILYARTINGIRQYFYDRSNLPYEDELRIRVLPRTTSSPKYIERSYFGFVVFAFAAVGAGYFAAGAWLIWQYKEWRTLSLLTVILLFAAAHWALYAGLARHRERSYLQKQIIGVDIDGVLNAHRPHFSGFLKIHVGKTLAPEEIKRIPVHEMENSEISELDEKAVFNRGDYWIEMPIFEEGLGTILRKFRNVLGYQIWIFTHRPYPEPAMFPDGRAEEYWSSWRTSSIWGLVTRYTHRMDAWLEDRGIPGFFRGRLISSITKKWLRKHDIPYDRITVEGGNTSTADARMLVRNRYSSARAHEFRAFVEDHLPNARKLSNVCQVVFLIDHPYNQCPPESLPKNVLRVKSWIEIYAAMRRLF
jgi:uncharacterized HAD superfamily protein